MANCVREKNRQAYETKKIESDGEEKVTFVRVELRCTYMFICRETVIDGEGEGEKTMTWNSSEKTEF
jgi:hypothetical protein